MRLGSLIKRSASGSWEVITPQLRRMPHHPGVGYVIVSRVLVLLAMMALAPDVANAQLDTMTSHCFQFDRQYFHWGGRPPGGGDYLIDSSAVVRLSPELHPYGDVHWGLPPQKPMTLVGT